MTDTCPFFGASDFILGETTCDGKKKMFELMRRIKPLHLMHLPYDTNGGHYEQDLRVVQRCKRMVFKPQPAE